MLNILSATALSATIALTTLAPTPAYAADEGDVARFLLGAGFLAILARAIHENREDDDHDDRDDDDRDDQKQVINRYVTNKHVTKVIRKPVQKAKPPHVEVQRPTRVTPRPVEVHRVVPESCARTFRTEDGNRSFFTRICLEEAGVRTASLPDQCERVLDMPGDRENRRAWNRSCLENYGYRIR